MVLKRYSEVKNSKLIIGKISFINAMDSEMLL